MEASAVLASETALPSNHPRSVVQRPQDTAKRLAARERITGATQLAKALGEPGKAIVAHIKEWLAPARVMAEPGDIVIAGGDMTDVVNHAEAALLARSVPIYQRGGGLIRPVRVSTASPDVVRREVGATVLVSVRETWLSEAMGQAARWFRPTRAGHLVPCDPPAVYAGTLLARGQWRFPALRAVLSAPTLAADGRIVDRDRSGLCIFPSIVCAQWSSLTRG